MKAYKLSDEQARAMRDRHAAGEDLGALAREFGISYSFAWQVIVGRRHPHALGPTRVVGGR